MINNRREEKEWHTPEEVLRMLSCLDHFLGRTSDLYNPHKNEFQAGSKAENEIASFSSPESVKGAQYSGLLSMEAAADHMMAFIDTLKEPAKTMAPWTCARGALESSALAVWLLDHNIDARTRVGRHYSFRHEGLLQQRKMKQEEGKDAEVLQATERIRRLEQQATALGYSPIRNRNNDIQAVGQHFPSIIEMIGTTLDERKAYRLFSAVAHGHHWATTQIGFKIVEYPDSRGQLLKGLEKHLHPSYVLYLGVVTTRSFAKVLWQIWNLYGWDLAEVIELFEETYENLGCNELDRFWRP